MLSAQNTRALMVLEGIVSQMFVMSCQVHTVILIPPSAYVECFGKIVTQNNLLG